jgi:20S proteasome subunit beta 6
MYKHAHKKEVATTAMAQMLSTTLYHKRFFPFYAMNVLGGVDAEGKGAVYCYDSIGSFERSGYACKGSGAVMITSLFDNQVGFKTQMKNKVALSLEDTKDLVISAFNGCAERDIYTGDSIDLTIITKEGVKWEKVPLRRD